ncbi:hypothetical protein F5J12DRAFT_780720 [Pisolithus orientalis]|uniref:uncharacterized protein n=1 Tax=Pisolithus orientalis TaxID=936130 RepID=UPI002225520F|nr:uncharacterized protein F5J12DRAFT_780720 [Pisolithus orientalis]KAI6025980.1 hypothetical protein F5J12DRAFT_780720 [Pisolithus orientalis]
MAKCKQHKAVREEAACLEAERLEREQLDTEQHEREQLEAEKWEQEWLEAKRKEQEWCELPEGVEPGTEEVGAKARKKRALEDVTSLRAGEKKKVTQVRSAIPGELEAGPLGVVMATATPSNPLVAVVIKRFELITVAMDQQTTEMQARRETQCWFNSQLGDLLDQQGAALRCGRPGLKSLQSDCEGVGMELDEGIMHWPEDMHIKGWWSSLESGEEKELWMSKGEVFEGDSK